MNMTLSFLFWAVFASYVVHIIDERLIGGGFVAKVQEHWWPSDTARMFFFNAAFLTIAADPAMPPNVRCVVLSSGLSRTE